MFGFRKDKEIKEEELFEEDDIIEVKDPNIIDVNIKIETIEIFNENYNIAIFIQYDKKNKVIVNPDTNSSKVYVLTDDQDILTESSIDSYEELSKLTNNMIDFTKKLSIHAVRDLVQVISLKAALQSLKGTNLELNLLQYEGNKDLRIPPSKHGIAYMNYELDYNHLSNNMMINDDDVLETGEIGFIAYDKMGVNDFNIKYIFEYDPGTDDEVDALLLKLLDNGDIEFIPDSENKFKVSSAFYRDDNGITFIKTL